MEIDRIILNLDGASRGNPGPAAIGVILKSEDNRVIGTISQRIGVTTNNRAEYRALIAGLKKAISLGAREVIVKSDSELLVRQIQGRYRVRNADLKPLYAEAVKLAGSLDGFQINTVPREQNREADKLANGALDGNCAPLP